VIERVDTDRELKVPADQRVFGEEASGRWIVVGVRRGID
jgi:hypothetical protein